jgi:uncharacterized protein with HEPN domain
MLNPFVKEKLENILDHAETISVYFKEIHQPADFKTLPEGKKSFDAIMSRLQALGENFRKIEKLQPGFTQEYIHADVEKIIKFRDLISHHYEKLDIDIIYETCRDKIPELLSSVKNFLENN